MNPSTGAVIEGGYQIQHCPPEAQYQQILLNWAKTGQHGPMPRPDPRRGLGCWELTPGAHGQGSGMVMLRETVCLN